MPSTWPARPPPWRRTRSPIRNGRAEISTMPAIRLPSVCWAARPKTTAVTAPPTASVRGVRPGDPERGERREDEERQADEEADRARRAGVDAAEEPRLHPAPEVASERPAEHDQHDRRGDAHGRVDAEDLLAEDVRDDRRDVSGTISSSSRRARRARCSVCSVIERARAAGALASKRGLLRASGMSLRQHCPPHRVSSPPAACDRGHTVDPTASRAAPVAPAQNRLVCRTGSGFGGASAGGGRSKRGGVSRPLRRRPGSRASSSLRAPGCRYAPLR